MRRDERPALRYSGEGLKESPAEQKEEKIPVIALSLRQFVREFFWNYDNFVKVYVPQAKPPFLLIVAWFCGMSSAVAIVEDLAKYLINDWLILWGIIIFGGMGLGLFGYWVGSAFYYLKVVLSQGKRNFKVSRHLYLYSGLPLYLTAILIEMLATIKYGYRYFLGGQSVVFLACLAILLLMGIIAAVRLSFRGVRMLQLTVRNRSIFFFIVLPITYYVLVSGPPYIYIRNYLHAHALELERQASDQAQRGNYVEAERLFKQALNNFSDNDPAESGAIYDQLGGLLDKQAQRQPAIEQYQKALRYFGMDSVHYCAILGRINMLQGSHLEAIRNLEKALGFDPDDYEANRNLGYIYLGEISETTTDYNKALKYNEKAYHLSKDNETTYNLAVTYFRLSRLDEALPLFESLDRIEPNGQVKYYLGKIYYFDNDLNKAKIYLQDAIIYDADFKTYSDVNAILEQK